MAAIAIPDNVRPALAAILKYRFWILSALVPVVLVPLLFVGAASLRERIAVQRRQIDAKLGQARTVMAVQPHPNEGWQVAIDADTQAADKETLEEWQRFWHSQRDLRQWPATELGDAFLADLAKLQPGGALDRQSLVRYREKAPLLARSLPARMGVEDAMVEKQAEVGRIGGARPGAMTGGVPDLAPALTWSPASQRRLYESFVWQNVPNTTQVLMAQEELWVYGLFCRLLAGFVSKATGAHDSPITLVDELTVGFPASAGLDKEQSRQRILMPKVVEGQPDGMRGMELPPGMEGAPEAMWHPRFTSGGGQRGPRPEDPTGGGGQVAASPDDAYRGWVYVDFAGKPLSTAELATVPAMSMVHLMPFVLRVVVDQRHLDRLLTTLAESPIPIDVRQVTVNGDSGGAGGIDAASFQRDGAGAIPDGRGGRRPNDLLVELRGTVALAVPPTGKAGTEATP